MSARITGGYNLGVDDTTGVGNTWTRVDVRGRADDGSIMSGSAQRIRIKNTHGSQTLSVAFNADGLGAVVISAGAEKEFEDVNVRFFWLKGSGSGTTWNANFLAAGGRLG